MVRVVACASGPCVVCRGYTRLRPAPSAARYKPSHRLPTPPQLFLTFFKTLEGRQVTIELKNDLALTGKLDSVDQFLNFKLSGVSVGSPERFPQLLSVKTVFVRGAVVRYVHVDPAGVDVDLLQDAARREALESTKRK